MTGSYIYASIILHNHWLNIKVFILSMLIEGQIDG